MEMLWQKPASVMPRELDAKRILKRVLDSTVSPKARELVWLGTAGRFKSFQVILS
jgi:hypothetical protein